MTDKLKPCPFCGGEARTRDLNIKIPYEGIAHFVECCQCDVRSGISFDGEQAAIEAWNTRKPMDRIVEQLENASCYIEDGDGHAGHVVFTDEAIDIVKGERINDARRKDGNVG